MDTGILLESGTNELEILEFMVAGNHYGINVAKIREILPYTTVVPVPNAHPSIEGIFMPREEVITSIDLAKALHLKPSEHPESDLFVVTYFNNTNAAFHVHSIVGINRVSWADILTPDVALGAAGNGVSTGVIKYEGRLIILLDFEKIIADISPELSIRIQDVDTLGKRERCDQPILIAEDSAMLSQLLQDCLKEAGYTNLVVTRDGQEAWNTISAMAENGTLEQGIRLVITDIEMPKMDGHHLTKLIKTNAKTSFLPVIIFSSMISEELKRKGEALGANAQITKPEIGHLVTEIDRFMN